MALLSGKALAQAIISGANNITINKQCVDELNVFPVPDGDTGTNMSMTINACKRELELLCDSDPTVEKTAEVAASALLRGARGNSGVILSLLFRGFSKGLKGKRSADGADIAKALALGVSASYKAVMKPTEGTILTVAREAAEAVESMVGCEPIAVMEKIVERSKVSLEHTPELLPVLKKAGVVDAGGMGFVVIFEGMLAALKGSPIVAADTKQSTETKQPVNAVADYQGDITFGYCTEYIVNKSVKAPDSLKLRAYLETMGDSVVCVEDDDIIKVHVHTNHPGNAIEEGLKFGSLMNLKIDNMRIQHQNKVSEAEQTKSNENYMPVDPNRSYGFVAVAAGAGLSSLFADLGVDKVVSGGQTMNPSTNDILRAIQSIPASAVFVLPNNKNIIMAAEQSVKLADRRVCVLQTRTIPQGISAMLAFDGTLSYDENRLNMTKQFDSVQTGLVTFAARDSEFDGHSIKKGEILGLDNGKLSFTERDIQKTVVKLTKALIKKASDSGFITLIYGSDITDEQADAARAALQERFGDDHDITLVNGGQPVYYYMISVE